MRIRIQNFIQFYIKIQMQVWKTFILMFSETNIFSGQYVYIKNSLDHLDSKSIRNMEKSTAQKSVRPKNCFKVWGCHILLVFRVPTWCVMVLGCRIWLVFRTLGCYIWLVIRPWDVIFDLFVKVLGWDIWLMQDVISDFLVKVLGCDISLMQVVIYIWLVC